MEKIIYTFGKYLIEISNDLKFEAYENKYSAGIIIYDSNGKYDITHNKIDWNRILINYNDGSWKDLPFHKGTWGLLPKEIKIMEIGADERQ